MIQKIKNEIDKLEVKSQQTFVNTDETYNYWTHYIDRNEVMEILDKYNKLSKKKKGVLII